MWQGREAKASLTTERFSALTLGFFDVAAAQRVLAEALRQFQCPNAGLLRCGVARLSPGPA